jgi:uncharacterized protein DUF6508
MISESTGAPRRSEINTGGPTGVDWAAVLAFLPVFEQPGFSPGQWEGEYFSAFYSYYPEVLRFLETLDSAGVIYGFDWPAWQREAERYMREPSVLARARLPTLRKLLTLHARKDRFCEGHFAAVLESGHIIAILKRVETLVARQ